MPEDQEIDGASLDMNRAIEICQQLEKKTDLQISYGSIAFWIAIIRKVEEDLPEDMSLKDFCAFLGEHWNRIATISVREEGGKEDAD